MSLAIDCDAVEAVLLVDGWHGVVNHSFAIVPYEFVWQGEVVLGGGQVKGFQRTARNGSRRMATR
jgi:hypothetical protein